MDFEPSLDSSSYYMGYEFNVHRPPSTLTCVQSRDVSAAPCQPPPSSTRTETERLSDFSFRIFAYISYDTSSSSDRTTRGLPASALILRSTVGHSKLTWGSPLRSQSSRVSLSWPSRTSNCQWRCDRTAQFELLDLCDSCASPLPTTADGILTTLTWLCIGIAAEPYYVSPHLYVYSPIQRSLVPLSGCQDPFDEQNGIDDVRVRNVFKEIERLISIEWKPGVWSSVVMRGDDLREARCKILDINSGLETIRGKSAAPVMRTVVGVGASGMSRNSHSDSFDTTHDIHLHG